MSRTNPPRPRYLSPSSAAVVAASLALGALLAFSGKLPQGQTAEFFFVCAAIALPVGAHAGGLRARGDRVSILREISAVLAAVAGALLAAWLVSSMSR